MSYYTTSLKKIRASIPQNILLTFRCSVEQLSFVSVLCDTTRMDGIRLGTVSSMLIMK